MDRLSDLPYDLRRRIGSLLSLEDAIKMSCVSSQWRTCLSWVTRLVLHQRKLEPKLQRNDQDFKDFVNRTLALHEGDLEKFDLRTSPHHNDVDAWISVAINSNVQKLIVDVSPSRAELPHGWCTCETLRVLELHNINLYVPKTLRLPILKSLTLSRVKFYDQDSTNKLFSTCPVLEELRIGYCDMRLIDTLRISGHNLKIINVLLVNKSIDVEIFAPNLQRIAYDADPPSLSSETLSSLNIVNFGYYQRPTDLPADVLHRRTIDNMMRIRNASYMILQDSYLEILAEVQTSLASHPSMCYRLEHLQPDIYSTRDQVQTLILLLRHYPNLKYLHITVKGRHPSTDMHNVEEPWNLQGLSFAACPLKKLKSVHIIMEERGGEPILYLIRYLIEHAEVLEEMNIRPSMYRKKCGLTCVGMDEEIRPFNKASANAVIVVTEKISAVNSK